MEGRRHLAAEHRSRLKKVWADGKYHNPIAPADLNKDFDETAILNGEE